MMRDAEAVVATHNMTGPATDSNHKYNIGLPTKLPNWDVGFGGNLGDSDDKNEQLDFLRLDSAAPFFHTLATGVQQVCRP